MAPDDQVPTDIQPLDAHDIASARFSMARGQGYEVLDVDSFLDQAEAALSGSPAERAAFRTEIARARFRVLRRSGYDLVQVDTFVDRLAATFATDEPPASTESSIEDGTEVHAEPSLRQRAEAQELASVARLPLGARFDTSNRLFSGYQISFVDSLVEEIASTLKRDSPGTPNLDPTGIPTSRPGYRKRDVDAWLEMVRDHVQRA